MWCSFSLDTSCSYHSSYLWMAQLHLPHLLCNALVASSAFKSIKKTLSGKERIRLSCGSMLCRACLHYWWIPWWPRHICDSISIISISVISLLPNGVMRPRDSRSTMDSSILRRRRGLIQRTWAQYIINFPPITFSPVISYYHSQMQIGRENWMTWSHLSKMYGILKSTSIRTKLCKFCWQRNLRYLYSNYGVAFTYPLANSQ